MACGLPVIASSRAALPEVVGDAGILIDPADAGAITEAITRLLGSGDLRRELADRSRERAARFGWPRAAAATAAILQRFA